MYFPGDIDRTFWEVMAGDHSTLIRNVVEWALNEERAVTVTGPGLLDVTAWRQKNSMTVHLVNLTNPMMWKAPYREFVPAGPQTVRVRLPQGAKVAGVHLLVSGRTPQATSSNGAIRLTVPTVVDHEVVAIDF